MKSRINIPKNLTQGILTPQEQTLKIRSKAKHLFIGLPKEDNFQENRIALVPAAVRTLVRAGHRIIIEKGAGEKANYTDYEYSEAGAEIAYSRDCVFEATVLLKVAPVTNEEINLCHPGQILISPLHLPTLSDNFVSRLTQKRVTALAMEYMRDESGIFPFVRMMSEIAGISAMQTAAELLSYANKGKGVLLGGISGVPPTKVVILGAGVVGRVATRVALGYGAEVRVFDNSIKKLMRLQNDIGTKLYTGTFNTPELEQELCSSDVAIGAIHSEIGRTPCMISEDMVARMKPRAVIIDVSIDQGGCFATSRVTTHDQPIFRMHDVIHYCVPNIVSRFPRTSSVAFSNILTSFFSEASNTEGIEALLQTSMGFRNGVYIYKGFLTNKYLSERFDMKYTDLNLLLMTNL